MIHKQYHPGPLEVPVQKKAVPVIPRLLSHWHLAVAVSRPFLFHFHPMMPRGPSYFKALLPCSLIVIYLRRRSLPSTPSPSSSLSLCRCRGHRFCGFLDSFTLGLKTDGLKLRSSEEVPFLLFTCFEVKRYLVISFYYSHILWHKIWVDEIFILSLSRKDQK